MKPRRTGLHVAGALGIPARLDPVARGQIDAFSGPDISICNQITQIYAASQLVAPASAFTI